MVGGRVGGVILRTKRNVLAADRRERRLSFFEMCVYFEDTGNMMSVKQEKPTGKYKSGASFGGA